MESNPESITLQQAFEAFTRKCQLRNLAKDTILYYQESFKYLTTSISSDSKASMLSETILDNLVMNLKASMTDTSINTRLREIRTFVNFCIELGYVKPMKPAFP